MRGILLCLAFTYATGVFAATDGCDELKIWRMRLDLAAANLTNANTTRTPEGGPYQPFVIKSCSNGSCLVERKTIPEIRYMPDHPDADSEGYVAFPDVDQKGEYLALKVAAEKVSDLVSSQTCGTDMKEN